MTAATVTPSQSRMPIDAFAAVVMVGLTFSWGLNGVAAKLANQGFNPLFVAFARAALGALILYVWLRWRGISLFERDGSLFGGVLAGLLFGAEFVCIMVALDYTSVGRGALLVNTMPFWALIGGHFLLGERITLAKFAGLLLAFAGVVLIFFDKLGVPGPDAYIGDLLSLCAGVFWATTTFAIRLTRVGEVRAEKVLLYQLVIGALLVFPLFPFGGPILRDVGTVSVSALLFQAVYVVAFTYAIWFWLVSRYAASGLSSFVFLTPAFGVLCGSVILGEPLTINIFAALALIVVGLTIVNRPVRARNGHA